MWYLIETHDNKQIIKDWDHSPTDKELHELNYFSCSGGHCYATKEALFKGEQILDRPCVVCGNWVKTTYQHNEKMIERNMCFSCNLWTDRIEITKNNKKVMIVEGIMYTIVEDFIGPGMRGFGGHKFTFETFKGEIKISKNVWCGGDIPKHFLDKIPDNAKIIK